MIKFHAHSIPRWLPMRLMGPSLPKMTTIRQKTLPWRTYGSVFPEVQIGCEREPSKYFWEYIFQSAFMGLFTFQIKIPRELLGIQADRFNPFTSSPGENITLKKKEKSMLHCQQPRGRTGAFICRLKVVYLVLLNISFLQHSGQCPALGSELQE